MFTIAICNENENDIKRIKYIVEQYMEHNKLSYAIYSFSSGEDFLESTVNFDLTFLDIVMTGINGIQTGKKLRSKNKNTKIIYTTNYMQYLEQAINEIHAFAYLMKPIKKEELESQLNDLVLLANEEKKKVVKIRFKTIAIDHEREIKSKIMDISVRDIYYFEYVNRKICIRLKDKSYFFNETMKELNKKMRKYDFYSCHQNYLVNLKHVTNINGYEVCLNNSEKLPLSQKRSAEFRKNLNIYIQKEL